MKLEINKGLFHYSAYSEYMQNILYIHSELLLFLRLRPTSYWTFVADFCCKVLLHNHAKIIFNKLRKIASSEIDDNILITGQHSCKRTAYIKS